MSDRQMTTICKPRITFQDLKDFATYVSILESQLLNARQTVEHLKARADRTDEYLRANSVTIEHLKNELRVARELQEKTIHDLRLEKEIADTSRAYARVWRENMKLAGIPLKGFRIDKGGKLVRDQRRLDVSTRLKQKDSKRVRVARKGQA